MEYARVNATRVAKSINRLLVMAALSSGCASITPPDGGERDTKAPVLQLTEPAQRALLVAGRQITLHFDEPVTTDRLTEQLIVTPESDLGTPRVIEKENRLTVIFQRPFEQATTYTLDFGQAIVDVTERTKAETVRLVFSTSTFVDSGRVSGKVSNLLTGKPAANVLVGLYPNSVPDSTGPARQAARYRTKTDVKGEFTLQNLKTDTYRLYAFADANNNQRYDEPELLAYTPEVVDTRRPDTAVFLYATRLDTRPPYIASRKERTGVVQLKYSEGVQAIRIRALSREEGGAITFRHDEQQPNQVLVFGKPRDIAHQYVLLAEDSAGNAHFDTLTTRFTAVPPVGNEGVITPTIEQGLFEEETGWRLTFPVPLTILKSKIGRVIVRPGAQGSTSGTPDALPSETVEIGKNARLDSSSSLLFVKLTSQLGKAAGEINITLDSTAVVTSTGQPVSARPLKAPRPPDESSVGSITIRPESQEKSFALELVKADNTVVRRYEHWLKSQDKKAPPLTVITWSNLPPGAYRVRALIDVNGDGHWEGPDRSFRRLPERVVFSADELGVRANWEQELTFRF